MDMPSVDFSPALSRSSSRGLTSASSLSRGVRRFMA